MKVSCAQLNPIIGDFDYNIQKLSESCALANDRDSDLIIFPELFLSGYPPRDLLTLPWFMTHVQAAIEKVRLLSKKYPNLGVLLGTPTLSDIREDKVSHHSIHNSAVLIQNGEILFTQHKTLLPSYDVFDEKRYFKPATQVTVFPFKDEVLGISICEDGWAQSAEIPNSYDQNPIQDLADQGATLMINIMASPFEHGKSSVRDALFKEHVTRYSVPFICVNQAGGQDELVFDGGSIMIASNEELVHAPFFDEALISIDSKILYVVKNERNRLAPHIYLLTGEKVIGHQDSVTRTNSVESQCYKALVCGVRDYVKKCGFKRVHLGLSGGIDSALTACIAVDALGPENVIGVSLPSPYSSQGSLDDAERLAKNLGIKYDVISISESFSELSKTLEKSLKNLKSHLTTSSSSDVTMENLQARIRGNILMAISNSCESLLLSTGNKSEMAVGYCTLYGDMNGGLSVLSDVPKTLVYALANHVNRESERIPQNSITKPPSAELRPDQKDQDTLPDYDLLDQIIDLVIEKGKSEEDLVSLGFDKTVSSWVVSAIQRNEYKRRQAAPGLKITSKAFGMGRRFPIAAHY